MKNIFIIPTDTCYGIGCAIGDADAYKKIYTIKNRGYDKPLAILVPDLDRLYDNTPLTEEQLNFLSEYNRPFTILTDCMRVSMLLAYEDEYINYPNKDQYQKIAFRVAHRPSHVALLEEVGPIFLTSANISGEPENYTIEGLKKSFEPHLDQIEILEEVDLDESIRPSDIFSFVGDTLEIKYVRKYD